MNYTNADLTAREKEVLKLVCKGFSNIEIAQELCISTHTAKAHIAAILRKLGVQNRTLAAFITGQQNILDVSK